MTTKILKYIIGVLIIGAIFCILFFTLYKPKMELEISEGRIKEIKTMVQLCSVDIYNEVPILDTINNRVMFAVQKQRGSISFDLEKLEIKNEKDSVFIYLSPEIIELNEATVPESWKVIDTKAIGALSLFRKDDMPEEDEKILKSKIKDHSVKQLYNIGIIEKARADGALTLKGLMEKVYKKPVVVIDTTPKGAHYIENVPSNL